MALAYHEFNNPFKVKEHLDKAKLARGLELEVTGMLGRRLKAQTNDIAQLTLNVSKHRGTRETPASASNSTTVEVEAAKTAEVPASEEAAAGEEEAAAVADPGADWINTQNVLLEESELLETTKFDAGEDRNYTALDTLDQAIVLALCVNVKNMNPHHGLTMEEMKPYVERVIEDGLKDDWTVSSMALLLRCQLERERPKTVERSILQLQVLVEQFHDKEPCRMDRLRYLFSLAYPPSVQLQKVVGEGFLSMNANRSALEIFEKLELWSLVIECHGRLGQTTKAEALAREQLALNETPEMWCNLGDITSDDECYIKAWELSGKRYARAMRTLGTNHAKAGSNRTKEAIECMQLSLNINPMYPQVWLRLGVCHMQNNDLDGAARAFLRVVSQIPDDGETWNNLAAVYLRLDKKEQAFKAFEQAIKYKQESPKMWQNMMYCCLETGRWQQAIYTITRLISMDAECLDLEALDFLVQKAVRDKANHGSLHRAMEQLVTCISESPLSSNAQVWGLFALFYGGIGHGERELEYRQKQCRALLNAEWKIETPKFEILADAIILLVDCLVEAGDAKSLFDAKTKLNSVIKQADTNFHENEWHAKLAAKLASIS